MDMEVYVPVLGPLQLRCHEASSTKMPCNERYTEHIQKLGLLPFIHMVIRSTPNMNPSAITAFVDRRRLETHIFHLCIGEMTMTF
jgi:hypothetical protein